MGKVLMGLQVLHQAGHALTTWQVFRRMLGMLLSALPGLAGFLWVGFDQRRRGWHDHIGQSLVIRVQPPKAAKRYSLKLGTGGHNHP